MTYHTVLFFPFTETNIKILTKKKAVSLIRLERINAASGCDKLKWLGVQLKLFPMNRLIQAPQRAIPCRICNFL